MKVAMMKNSDAILRGAAGATGGGAGFWADGEDGLSALRQVLRAGVWCGACGTLVYGLMTLLDMVQSWAVSRVIASLAL